MGCIGSLAVTETVARAVREKKTALLMQFYTDYMQGTLTIHWENTMDNTYSELLITLHRQHDCFHIIFGFYFRVYEPIACVFIM